MGRTERQGGAPWARVTARNGAALEEREGCLAPGGRIVGTYIHGLFDSPAVLGRWLAQLGLERLEVPRQHGPQARDRDYDRLAEHLAAHVDLAAIRRLVERAQE